MDTIAPRRLHPTLSRERAPFRVVPLSFLAGAAAGAAYGAALRAWMRLVSDEPEFSWSGTLFIIGAFTLTFGFAGLVVGARRRGWQALLVPSRIVAIVVSLSCFVGAGVLMLPTIVFGALALARTDWRRGVRVTLATLSGLSVLPVVADPGDAGLVDLVIAGLAYLVLVVAEIRVFAEPYRPSVGRLPVGAKVLAGAAAGLAVLGVLAMTVGVMTSGGG
jgi:hypothetical protein